MRSTSSNLNFWNRTLNAQPYLYRGGGQICPPLNYFNIAPKLNKSFALIHPEFESNLIVHIFRKFEVSRTTGSDVIFAFVRDT